MRFLASLPNAQEIIVVFFDQTQRVEHFDRERPEALFERLKTIPDGGNTALRDAIVFSLRALGTSGGRSALVLLTDGIDTVSATTRPELDKAVQSTAVTIYPVAYPASPAGDGPDPQEALKELNRLAQITGGRLFKLPNEQALPGVLDEIAADLRAQYVLGFAPEAAGSPGAAEDLRQGARPREGRRPPPRRLPSPALRQPRGRYDVDEPPGWSKGREQAGHQDCGHARTRAPETRAHPPPATSAWTARRTLSCTSAGTSGSGAVRHIRSTCSRPVAGGLATGAGGEVALHARAGPRGDVPLEVAREQPDDVGARPRGSGRRRLAPRGHERGERLAQPAARAVEAGLHRRDAEPGHLRHLGRGEPLDVAQEQHLAVGTVERRDRAPAARPRGGRPRAPRPAAGQGRRGRGPRARPGCPARPRRGRTRCAASS